MVCCLIEFLTFTIAVIIRPVMADASVIKESIFVYPDRVEGYPEKYSETR